ncbi:MAG: hypothetical protein R3Y43_00870 [Alphaproteobacteria bacterium]
MQNMAVVKLRELMLEYSLNQPQLALRVFIPQNRICEILKQKRRFSLETDIKLCKFFNLNFCYFLDLQREYELELACAKYKKDIDKIISV